MFSLFTGQRHENMWKDLWPQVGSWREDSSLRNACCSACCPLSKMSSEIHTGRLGGLINMHIYPLTLPVTVNSSSGYRHTHSYMDTHTKARPLMSSKVHRSVKEDSRCRSREPFYWLAVVCSQQCPLPSPSAPHPLPSNQTIAWLAFPATGELIPYSEGQWEDEVERDLSVSSAAKSQLFCRCNHTQRILVWQ